MKHIISLKAFVISLVVLFFLSLIYFLTILSSGQSEFCKEMVQCTSDTQRNKALVCDISTCSKPYELTIKDIDMYIQTNIITVLAVLGIITYGITLTGIRIAKK